ncbi:UNVERIFIED_CONTAM: hypothetical protein Sangu_0501200 [Sesamum angustifolium]|uniref:Uncharacterized protein n=1 Tax=Sesamum angustifolium TaxID=2727405 RepID=A0AAW2Q8Y3_9LAMI
MAETQPKRLREEPLHEDSGSEFDDSSATSKRHKPYNTILNLLEEEEVDGESTHEPDHELSQDLSAIFTTLQQELSSSSTSCDSSTTTFDFDSLPSTAAVEEPDPSHQATAAEDDGVKSVMRHLLEASDDELGIPNRRDEIENNVEILNSVQDFPFGFAEHEGLWELEDEAANYYTVLQSELFM